MGARHKHRSRLRPTRREIYSNWIMLNQDGRPMVRMSEERAKWYLKKGLAEMAGDDPPAIRINFEPGGPGRPYDKFHMGHKENQCVVCGATEDLTKHHVIPYCFRHHLPDELKRNNSHDILPLCIPCHEYYEDEATKLRRKLADEYGCDNLCGFNAYKLSEFDVISGYASTIIKHGDRIPREQQKYMINQIYKYLNANKLPYDTFRDILNHRKNRYDIVGYVPYGEYIISKIDDYNAFIRLWRTHFIETMNPRYLPNGWDIEYEQLDVVASSLVTSNDMSERSKDT